MTYLLDTTTISDWMDEVPRIDAHLAGLPTEDRVVICPIVRGEILFGIARLPAGRRRQRLELRAAHAFAAFPCESTPEGAGDFYARVRLEQERKGLALGGNDLWIVATAMALKATLVSSDSDFGRIEGFSVEDWTR